ncbi:hypothetical protein Y032_0067g44 [Ancylostoma ceylanicum]|uniref:Uncharacterized protein n=1 Tax=Ancylostoma ceylanicum TaxID=53326 RepID=A0A016TZF2_9BILA|nr:hypothetical protein Y032_0067g44 [Ancylostoma ceylanicum]
MDKQRPLSSRTSSKPFLSQSALSRSKLLQKQHLSSSSQRLSFRPIYDSSTSSVQGISVLFAEIAAPREEVRSHLNFNLSTVPNVFLCRRAQHKQGQMSLYGHYVDEVPGSRCPILVQEILERTEVLLQISSEEHPASNDGSNAALGSDEDMFAASNEMKAVILNATSEADINVHIDRRLRFRPSVALIEKQGIVRERVNQFRRLGNFMPMETISGRVSTASAIVALTFRL